MRGKQLIASLVFLFFLGVSRAQIIEIDSCVHYDKLENAYLLLTKDLTTSNWYCIGIFTYARNVTIDLNGHSVNSSWVAIHINNADGVLIKNGKVFGKVGIGLNYFNDTTINSIFFEGNEHSIHILQWKGIGENLIIKNSVFVSYRALDIPTLGGLVRNVELDNNRFYALGDSIIQPVDVEGFYAFNNYIEFKNQGFVLDSIKGGELKNNEFIGREGSWVGLWIRFGSQDLKIKRNNFRNSEIGIFMSDMNKKIKIEDNTFLNLNKGIDGRGEYITIANNVFAQSERGIVAPTLFNSSIIKNEFRDLKKHAIHFAGENIHISHNYFRAFGKWGAIETIRWFYPAGKNIIVTKNKIEKGRTAIKIDFPNSIISNNDIYSVRIGIFVRGENSSIIKNKVEEAYLGFLSWFADNLKIVNNEFINNYKYIPWLGGYHGYGLVLGFSKNAEVVKDTSENSCRNLYLFFSNYTKVLNGEYEELYENCVLTPYQLVKHNSWHNKFIRVWFDEVLEINSGDNVFLPKARKIHYLKQAPQYDDELNELIKMIEDYEKELLQFYQGVRSKPIEQKNLIVWLLIGFLALVIYYFFLR